MLARCDSGLFYQYVHTPYAYARQVVAIAILHALTQAVHNYYYYAILGYESQ